MSYSVVLEKLAKEKKEARDICKQIIEFGVTENQKIEIIYELALNLENNQAMKDIAEILKKYRETINKEENLDDNNKVDSKLIID